MKSLKLSLLLSLVFAGSAIAMEPRLSNEEILTAAANCQLKVFPRELKLELCNFYQEPTEKELDAECHKLLNQPTRNIIELQIPSDKILNFLLDRKKISLLSKIEHIDTSLPVDLMYSLLYKRAFSLIESFIVKNAIGCDPNISPEPYAILAFMCIQAMQFFHHHLEKDGEKIKKQYIDLGKFIIKRAPEEAKKCLQKYGYGPDHYPEFWNGE